jgi:hypothetical protein
VPQERLDVYERAGVRDEKGNTPTSVSSSCGWMFHGTNTEVVPKICNQGFNRIFNGKNAVKYGKVIVDG